MGRISFHSPLDAAQQITADFADSGCSDGYVCLSSVMESGFLASAAKCRKQLKVKDTPKSRESLRLVPDIWILIRSNLTPADKHASAPSSRDV